MVFSSRRGRPKSTRELHDTGTPELALKRLYALTDEAVDICHARGLLSDQEHWSALHLRWLYTLRYGAPGVKALDITRPGGVEANNDCPLWRGEREQELNQAIELLDLIGMREAVLALAVFNQRPHFLLAPDGFSTAPGNRARLARREKELAKLREALQRLAQLWGRRKRDSAAVTKDSHIPA